LRNDTGFNDDQMRLVDDVPNYSRWLEYIYVYVYMYMYVYIYVYICMYLMMFRIIVGD
jgi:hypothetical protein